MLAFFTAIDHHLFWIINSNHNGFFDGFFLLVTNFGSGWVVAPVLLFFIFTRIAAKGKISLIIFSSLILTASGLVNSHIKHLFHTPRPLTVFKQKETAGHNIAAKEVRQSHGKLLHIVGKELAEDSFPSGHTNTAFSAATLMILCFGRAFWPALAVAGLVGYSRIYIGAHFPSDVIGGALLGICVVGAGFIIFNLFQRRKI